MSPVRSTVVCLGVATLAVCAAGATIAARAPAGQRPDAPRFRSGVEIVNVTATVVDQSGRFVPGLQRDDFVVYEDDRPQPISEFSAARIPVSLGIALDTSESMTGEKTLEAQGAIARFLRALDDPGDEFFLLPFNDRPWLAQDWTRDRDAVARAIGHDTPAGRTALYDAVSEALPVVARGRNPKKAIVVISDGNDTNSRTPLASLREAIRQSEALVYAIGIDCSAGELPFRRRPAGAQYPFPFPPRGRGGLPRPVPPPRSPPEPPDRGWRPLCTDAVDALALRDLTDDSGGRTEIVRAPRDLSAATAGIASELSRQYFLAYAAAAKNDGRWHTIRVEVRDRPGYRVRARRGYIAG